MDSTRSSRWAFSTSPRPFALAKFVRSRSILWHWISPKEAKNFGMDGARLNM
jgi:hypothetical protein